MPLRIRENQDSPVIATFQSLANDDLDLESLLVQLQSPSARLLEATALLLVELAKQPTNDFDWSSAHPDVRRRLGFIAHRLSQKPELTMAVKKRLARSANHLYESVKNQPFDDLGFSSTTSEARIRRLKRHADDIDQRWKVWGEVELRGEFLL